MFRVNLCVALVVVSMACLLGLNTASAALVAYWDFDSAFTATVGGPTYDARSGCSQRVFQRQAGPGERRVREEMVDMLVGRDAMGLSGRDLIATANLSLLLFVGCTGKPSRIVPPAIDPDQAARLAIAEYDGDSDGLLSTGEMDRCAGLKRAVELYDTNRDQSVSADEIAVRIRMWQESKVGLMPLGCYVKINDQPLEGATVRFVPESFLGEAVKPASGITRASGAASISVADADLPDDQKGLSAVHVGVYKVEITHPNRTIPSRYNTRTTLGQEIARDNPDVMQGVVFDLSD